MVGVGGVLEDPRGGKHEYFGGKIAEELVHDWRREGRVRKVIHQAEVFPAVAAVQCWGKSAVGRRVILYVDNDAALGALVKGTSGSKPSAALVSRFWETVAAHGLFLWADRVPSAANPADAPSRGRCDELRRRGFEEVSPEAEGLLAW